MREWCRLRRNVPHWAIAELGHLPVHSYWWREVVCFWNALAARPVGDERRDILYDNCLWQGGQGSSHWSGQVAACLQGVGYLTGSLTILTAVALDEQRVWECLCAH